MSELDYMAYQKTIRELDAKNQIQAKQISCCRDALERISRAVSSDDAKYRSAVQSLAYAVIQARCALAILDEIPARESE